MSKPSIFQFELDALKAFAQNRKFILEVGTGVSTKSLAMAAQQCGGDMTTIDVVDNSPVKFDNVKYLIGYSISQGDMIVKGHPLFVPSRYKGVPDELIALGEATIASPCNMIRHACHERELDFYFGDSGEYCGLAEWSIVKNLIVKDGIIALHDIHYPKSSKNFQVYDIIRKSDDWDIHLKTSTIAGLLIAQKLK